MKVTNNDYFKKFDPYRDGEGAGGSSTSWRRPAVGAHVTIHYEGNGTEHFGTVVACDDKWVSVEFGSTTSRMGDWLETLEKPRTIRFAYDWDEGFWYEEAESGFQITIEEALSAKTLLEHVASLLNSEDGTRAECPHCGHVSTCDVHSRGCPRGELLELMRRDKATGRYVPAEET
jgi:hypothetical protein